MSREAIRAAVAVMTAVALAGCEHKPLGEPQADVAVRVAFDWSLAPEATPGGMSVYFYDTGSRISRRFDFRGGTGGRVALPPGQWHVMTYNNDSEVVMAADGAFDTHLLTTREGSILEGALGNTAAPPRRGKGSEEERVMVPPDMMWGYAQQAVDVNPAPGQEAVVTVAPQELVCTYDYEIRNVKNLRDVAQMCAALTGMSGGLYPASNTLHTETVTVPFAARKEDATTIAGEFYTFGHHEDNTSPHRLVLYVWLDNGDKLVYGTQSDKFDVTGQIHDAPDPRHVHLVIDGLDLPQPMENGSGFKPSADDWTEEHHDIEME